MLQRADATGVDEAPTDCRGDARDLREVGTLLQPVLVDVGVDEGPHAAVLQALDDRLGRHLRRLLPARGRDHPPAGVDRDDDPLAVGTEHVVEEVLVGEGRGPEDHALGTRAQRVAHRAEGAQAAAALHRHLELGGDLLDVVQVLRRAALRAVEVDDVQEAGTGLHPGPRRLQRGVLVDRGLGEVALHEAHRAALVDVDRRVEDHAGTLRVASVAKFASSASPCAEDFSGCDCAPKTLPEPTTVANVSP